MHQAAHNADHWELECSADLAQLPVPIAEPRPDQHPIAAAGQADQFVEHGVGRRVDASDLGEVQNDVVRDEAVGAPHGSNRVQRLKDLWQKAGPGIGSMFLMRQPSPVLSGPSSCPDHQRKSAPRPSIGRARHIPDSEIRPLALHPPPTPPQPSTLPPRLSLAFTWSSTVVLCGPVGCVLGGVPA